MAVGHINFKYMCKICTHAERYDYCELLGAIDKHYTIENVMDG